jgi:bacterial/archaeal transporter family-2 protein
MDQKIIFGALAVFIGMLLPVQAGINGQLARVSNNAFFAAFISFMVGTIFLTVILVFKKNGFSSPVAIAQTQPWWVWMGGIIGGLYVACVSLMVPKLGGALTFSLLIAGQLVFALVLDHNGWLGAAVKQISLGRVIGLLLLIGGVVLIRKF